MKRYIANTDFDWYSFLQASGPVEEVNFWQPSGTRAFQGISPGQPFFFKLKNPYYAIAGFGYFVRQSILPVWLAWEAFGPSNGAPDFLTLCSRIEKCRRLTGDRIDAQYKISCLMIAQPIFFDETDWIIQPRD